MIAYCYFRSKRNLCKHQVEVHGLQLAFTCDVCGAKRYSITDLNAHKRIHTDLRPMRPYICSLCPMTFTSCTVRLRHIRRDHTGERPYQCVYCPMKFFDNTCLKNHMTKHTNERNHQCVKCLRRFKTSSHLLRHKRIFSGSRNCITDGKRYQRMQEE